MSSEGQRGVRSYSTSLSRGGTQPRRGNPQSAAPPLHIRKLRPEKQEAWQEVCLSGLHPSGPVSSARLPLVPSSGKDRLPSQKRPLSRVWLIGMLMPSSHLSFTSTCQGTPSSSRLSPATKT